MSYKKITVVIPTWNRRSWLAEALGSVAKQSLPPDEIILIDDGSEDETESLVRERFPQVRYLRQAHQGVSSARNRGIQEAAGEWIALLDSDDLWEPQKLAWQCDAIREHPETKIIQTEEVWLRNGRRVNPRPIHQKKSGWIFADCVPLCIVSPSAAMIHREVFERIGLFDETLPACEDYDFWLRASLHYPIDTLPEALTIKRGGHEDQLKILENPALQPEQCALVQQDIRRRAAILLQGFQKREKQQEVEYYRRLTRVGRDGLDHEQ